MATLKYLHTSPKMSKQYYYTNMLSYVPFTRGIDKDGDECMIVEAQEIGKTQYPASIYQTPCGAIFLYYLHQDAYTSINRMEAPSAELLEEIQMAQQYPSAWALHAGLGISLEDAKEVANAALQAGLNSETITKWATHEFTEYYNNCNHNPANGKSNCTKKRSYSFHKVGNTMWIQSNYKEANKWYRPQSGVVFGCTNGKENTAWINQNLLREIK